jgi:hypothetical protein
VSRSCSPPRGAEHGGQHPGEPAGICAEGHEVQTLRPDVAEGDAPPVDLELLTVLSICAREMWAVRGLAYSRSTRPSPAGTIVTSVSHGPRVTAHATRYASPGMPGQAYEPGAHEVLSPLGAAYLPFFTVKMK